MKEIKNMLKIDTDMSVLLIDDTHWNNANLEEILDISYTITLYPIHGVSKKNIIEGQGEIILEQERINLGEKLDYKNLDSSNVHLYKSTIKGVDNIDEFLDKFENVVKKQILYQGDFIIQLV